MNKIFSLLLVSLSFAQNIDLVDMLYNDLRTGIESSSRSGQKVFWDYFGGETCTFCPAVDMAFDQLLDDYPNDVVLVTWADPYWSPYTDSELCIYIDEIGDCHDVREDYYNMTTSRPHYRRQGNQWSGTGGGITSADSAQIYDVTLRPTTANALGFETPYEIILNGYRDSLTIYYDITVVMDSYSPSDNMMIELIFVEDKVPIWFSGDGLVHNVRNLARHWVSTEPIIVENEGESQIFSGEMLMMDHNLWQISNDDPWNPENMKLVAIVQDYSSGDIFQSMQLNVNDFDIDNDGVGNSDDNCLFAYNPSQQDADDDANGGDACDPCDNANIFLDGNANGDYWRYGELDLEFTFVLDIFDIFRLMEIVEVGDEESCGYEAGDLTGEGNVNIFDVYALIAFVMD